MDKEYINKITLEYLLNPNIIVNKPSNNKNLEKDIKFYRKRIYQITKDMSKGNFLNDNLKNSFYNYISEIIYFLKQQDLEDIYQEEYINIIDNSSCHLESNDISFNENTEHNEYTEYTEYTNYNDFSNNIDKLLTIQAKNSKTSLNNFIKKINISTEEPSNIIPKKKHVNIKDPSLRTKGIKNNLKE